MEERRPRWAGSPAPSPSSPGGPGPRLHGRTERKERGLWGLSWGCRGKVGGAGSKEAGPQPPQPQLQAEAPSRGSMRYREDHWAAPPPRPPKSSGAFRGQCLSGGCCVRASTG